MTNKTKDNKPDQKPTKPVRKGIGGNPAAARSSELRKGGNRADSLLKRFD